MVTCFLREIGSMALFGGTSQQTAKVFSAKIIFHQFAKVFSCESIPQYSILSHVLARGAGCIISLVGRGAVISPDAVTTGYDAQVCVGQATIQA